MRGFGIEKKVAEVKAKMIDFFIAHGIEETFKLRVNSDEVAQKVEATLAAMNEEIKGIIEDAPENIRDEVAEQIGGAVMPADKFRTHFEEMLRADVYETLKSLTLAAEKLDPEGGYDRIINMSMVDVVTTLTRDEKIDNLLNNMKILGIHTILVNAATQARLKRMAPLLRALRDIGPTPGHFDVGVPEDSEPEGDEEGSGGLGSLFSALGGVSGHIDDSTEEGEEKESESDGDPFGGIIF